MSSINRKTLNDFIENSLQSQINPTPVATIADRGSKKPQILRFEAFSFIDF